MKKGPEIIYEYAKQSGFSGKPEDILIYQDTDSEFFSFGEILKLRGTTLCRDGKITDEAYEIIAEYGDVLNNGINEWAKKEFRSIDPRYVFKREKICDVALLQAKKFYILHILDKEEVKVDEFEYKGIAIAQATFSKEVKQLLKSVVESILLSKNRKTAIHLFQEGYENFMKMSPEEYGNYHISFSFITVQHLHMSIEHKGITEVAALAQLVKLGSVKSQPKHTAKFAADSASDIATRFPNVARFMN